MPFLNKKAAFSLIEILLVLFIIAFAFVLSSKIFARKDRKARIVFDKMIRLNRRLATVSKLRGKTYRLAIQLESEGPETYWVEKKQPSSAGPSGPSASAPKLSAEDSGFAIDKSFFSEPEAIPSFLTFTKAESPLWKKGKTEGLVYIYYYPQGLAQETSLQVFRPDNQAKWTLYLDPATKELSLLK